MVVESRAYLAYLFPYVLKASSYQLILPQRSTINWFAELGRSLTQGLQP